MGRRKTFANMPKTVILRCPNCSKTGRIAVSLEKSPQSFVCKHCEQEIRTPATKCCVVCAFSNKRCPYSVKMDAFVRGLVLR